MLTGRIRRDHLLDTYSSDPKVAMTVPAQGMHSGHGDAIVAVTFIVAGDQPTGKFFPSLLLTHGAQPLLNSALAAEVTHGRIELRQEAADDVQHRACFLGADSPAL